MDLFEWLSDTFYNFQDLFIQISKTDFLWFSENSVKKEWINQKTFNDHIVYISYHISIYGWMHVNWK